MSHDEARQRGWEELDVVIVTGDAYIDHPSFAMAILGRVLEAGGYRVGIVSQPDWRRVDDWRRFGRPRLFFAISAGNMDSMINHYTANKKVRNADAYSPGGRIGLRPDRATLSYCQRAREAYPGVPVIAGGVEASLRRLAHYDYWSDKVRRSILLDCKADLVVYGMGEEAILEIAQRLDRGQSVKHLRDMRGVAYALGASEQLPRWETPPHAPLPLGEGGRRPGEGLGETSSGRGDPSADPRPSPLPQGEGVANPHAPLPLGEGGRRPGEGLGPTSSGSGDPSANPHPNPLPKGEGAANPLPLGEGGRRPGEGLGPTSSGSGDPSANPHPSPLPKGEGVANPHAPLPLGEGGRRPGEGLGPISSGSGDPTANPHPSPLPKGEGVVFSPNTVDANTIVLPSFEAVAADKPTFAEATRIIHNETNPYNAKRLVQFHDRQAVVVNPPALPISQASMDVIYTLPYTRRPHPSYREPIPAFGMIKDSVTIMRGCFGGCTFCSITTHQGRIIQSRSKESVLGEIEQMAADPKFKGTISDIGGPTANMYEMRCTKPEVEAVCRRQSCVHPTICKLLGTDHGPLVQLMREARETPGIKKVLVASGIRMDLARRSPAYMKELVQHHVGGHLKVAPEHTDPEVLMKMRKPANDDFERFTDVFNRESKRAGKDQYIVPYFIASHPASDLDAMIHLAVFLKQNGYKPDQVQDFIPAPFDVATAMYYTGIDPFTKKPVHVARGLKDRKLQRALMQFFKPENYFEVREALQRAGRQDLIGDGCDSLIPSRPPKEALQKRREDANQRFAGDYVHTVPGTGAGKQKLPRQKRGDAKRPKPLAERGTAPKTGDYPRNAGKHSRRKPGPGYRPKA